MHRCELLSDRVGETADEDGAAPDLEDCQGDRETRWDDCGDGDGLGSRILHVLTLAFEIDGKEVIF